MEQKKQARKDYAKGEKRGEKTQKMISFKLDLKLLTWLNSKSNKGRYINELIERDIKQALTNYGDNEDVYNSDYQPPYVQHFDND